MPTIPRIEQLVGPMVGAAKGSLGRDWSKVRTVAEPQLDSLARSLASIGQQAMDGSLSAAEAAALLEIHKNTTRTVLLTVEGMGLLAVENAINAALGAVKDTLNGAVGFALL